MKTLGNYPILIPKKGTDMTKWSVVSCDQYTSEMEYWDKLYKEVGDAPSTLKIIFPEVFLPLEEGTERIKKINETMAKYIADGLFEEIKDSYILIKRDTCLGHSRLGLVAPVDLEDYSFIQPCSSVIRSTEDVVRDRIPPRLKIRRGAPIELPHIILLIDDRKKEVIEPLWAERNNFEKLYDFDLNMNGGHIEGYKVDAKRVQAIFDNYANNTIKTLYGKESNFVFAVGDGNHSLATAQAYWNEIKEDLTQEERKTHPARFALCEIENLHSEGILFEPIHRFVFNADTDFIDYLSINLKGDAKVRVFGNGEQREINVDSNSAKAIADIQKVVDQYIKENNACSVDYVHGEESLNSVSKNNKGIAIYMPKLEKEDLFGYVQDNGTLCRKSFSMGEADEKRFYLEAKRI